MIHVVTPENQHLYGRQLDQMFRLRHAFYVEGHGWGDLRSQDGRETDEFDEGEVAYLLSLDPFGDVAASVRLNPSLGPTLLAKFADRCDAPLEPSPTRWDISRWLARPQHRRADHARWPSHHQRELMLGVLEFAQSRGLTHLSMLAEHRIHERIAAYGWPSRTLGPPWSYEGGKGVAVAVEMEVGPHVLTLTRAKSGVLAPVLFEAKPGRAAVAAAAGEIPSPALVEAAAAIEPGALARLASALAAEVAEAAGRGEAAAAEVAASFARLMERAGFAAERLSPAATAPPPAPRPSERRPSPGAS